MKPEVNTLQWKILKHLATKPEEGLSLTKIVDWWVMENQLEKVRVLLREYIEQETSEIGDALEYLKREGLVEEVSSKEGSQFRLPADKREEILDDLRRNQ